MNDYRLDNSGKYVLFGKSTVDFYEFLGLDVDASLEEIKQKIRAKKNTIKFGELIGHIPKKNLYLQKETLEKIESVLLDQKLRDIYNKRIGLVKEPKQTIRMKFHKQSTPVKVIEIALLTAMFAAGAKSGADAIDSHIDTYNSNHNTIIEMTVPEGMDIKTINENFDDWGYSNLEVKDQNRDGYNVYEGDKIIGLTTRETAEKLEQNYDAENIGIEEAVEKLGETDTLRGEFKKYVDGDGDFKFNTPNLTLDGKKDEDVNVCVKFTVPAGATKADIKNHFKDYGIVKMLVKGPDRDIDTIYAGEVYVARTTIDIAENLNNWDVEEISLDEAVELLNSNNSLTGKFKDCYNGSADFEFRDIFSDRTMQ